MALQLAPLIDIFTLIIVFLLMSTVLGGVSIVFPPSMKSAKSVSTESVEAAPQVVINQQEVHIPILNRVIPLSVFKKQDPSELQALKSQVEAYIKNVDNESKGSVVNVNLLADAATPYSDVFDVVKALRKSGFQSVLFIAEGDKKQ